MNSIERRQEILKRLQTNGMVSIQSLADELQVSSMTIRGTLTVLQIKAWFAWNLVELCSTAVLYTNIT